MSERHWSLSYGCHAIATISRVHLAWFESNDIIWYSRSFNWYTCSNYNAKIAYKCRLLSIYDLIFILFLASLCDGDGERKNCNRLAMSYITWSIEMFQVYDRHKWTEHTHTQMSFFLQPFGGCKSCLLNDNTMYRHPFVDQSSCTPNRTNNKNVWQHTGERRQQPQKKKTATTVITILSIHEIATRVKNWCVFTCV